MKKDVKVVDREPRVGDMVKIVNAQCFSTNCGTPDYKNGDVLKIVKEGDEMGYYYYYYGYEDLQYFYRSEFVVVEEVNEFTKSDLEPCMVIEIRNGELFIVSKSKKGLCFVENNGRYVHFDSYNEKLLSIDEDEEWDIMKVYDFAESHYKSNDISTKDRCLIFERQESQKPSARDIKIKELQDQMDKIKKEMEELKDEK